MLAVGVDGAAILEPLRAGGRTDAIETETREEVEVSADGGARCVEG
jgi:hypothetical protein